MQYPSPLGQTPAVPIPSLAALCPSPILPVYGPIISLDLSRSSEFIIVATDGVAFVVSNPIPAPGQPCSGQKIDVTIKNTSGGALGAVTWGAAFKQAGSFASANGSQRTATFRYDGAFWVLVAGPTADIPN